MLNNLVIQYGALGLLVGILLVVSWRFYKHMLAEHKTLKEEIKVLRENENKMSENILKLTYQLSEVLAKNSDIMEQMLKKQELIDVFIDEFRAYFRRQDRDKDRY